MSNILLCTPELFDSANTVLTVSSEHSNFRSSKLKNVQPTEIWRSANLSPVSLVMDFGTSIDFSVVALMYTNLTSAATWRIRIADSEAALTTTPTHDSTVISFWPTANLTDWDRVSGYYVLPSALSGQWLRIDLVDGANLDGYMQAGRLYISKPWQPIVNIAYGWKLGYEDDSKHNLSKGGQTIITALGKRRVLEFTLDYQSESDMYDGAFSIERSRGMSKDILVIPDYSNTDRIHDWSVYGLMSNLSPIVNTRYGIFQKRYLVKELT